MTWNYLRDSMNTYLSQPNPVTARWEGEDHLRDPKFQLDAFRVSFILILCLKIDIICAETNKATTYFDFKFCSTERLGYFIVLLYDFESTRNLLGTLVHGIDA